MKTVRLERLYNLGDYESVRVGYEAVLTELEGANSEAVLKATADLEKLCDQYFTAGRFQKQEPLKQEKPKEQPKQEEKPKGVVVNLENIDWIDGGETDKGPYQKSASKPLDFYAAKKAIEEKGAALYIGDWKVWYMDKLDVLARRRK